MSHRDVLAISLTVVAMIGSPSCAQGSTDIELGLSAAGGTGGMGQPGAGGSLVLTAASSGSSSGSHPGSMSSGIITSSTSGGGTCGDGVCEPNESCVSCPVDCGTGCGACAHSWCNQGGPLPTSCNFCVLLICDYLPTCCTTTWDAACVAKAQQICVPACP
jgi:hypothetical protein